MSYRVIIDDMSNYSNMTREEKASIFADTPFTISGGDIPSIMGINPYKGGSNVDLYYNKINKTVRANLAKKIEKSTLKTNAKNRLVTELSNILILTKSMGWKLQYNGEEIKSESDFGIKVKG